MPKKKVVREIKINALSHWIAFARYIIFGSPYRIEIFKSDNGWRHRIRCRTNGKILNSSEAYASKQMALKTAMKLLLCPPTSIVEVEE